MALHGSLRVEASLATIPSRAAQLPQVVKTLSGCVDLVRVVLNGHKRVPECVRHHGQTVIYHHSKENLGARAKFFWASDGRGMQLICDDDIDYHRGYVEHMAEALRRYGNKAIVGLHARVVDGASTRLVAHFSEPLAQDTAVNVLGTGTIAYDPEYVKIRYDDFEHPNMIDMQLALLCQKRKSAMVAIARRALLLKPIATYGPSLFDAEGWEARTRELVASHSPWVIHQP